MEKNTSRKRSYISHDFVTFEILTYSLIKLYFFKKVTVWKEQLPGLIYALYVHQTFKTLIRLY